MVEGGGGREAAARAVFEQEQDKNNRARRLGTQSAGWDNLSPALAPPASHLME